MACLKERAFKIRPNNMMPAAEFGFVGFWSPFPFSFCKPVFRYSLLEHLITGIPGFPRRGAQHQAAQ